LATLNVLVYQIASKNCLHFLDTKKGFYGFIGCEAHDWLGASPVAFLPEPKEFGRQHGTLKTFTLRYYLGGAASQTGTFLAWHALQTV
jgi:hypothetical protein